MEYFFGSITRLKVGGSPPPSGLVPSIVPSRITGTAPLAVHFDATGSTSDQTSTPYRDLLYLWSFGDSNAASQYWPYGARAGTLSKDVDSGMVSAHVYEVPGDYTVTLTCNDGTGTAFTTVSIHVDDPETVYSGNKTICVSSTGLPVAGVGGVPAGAQCFQLATLELAIAKFTATDQRLLLKRDDTFTFSATTNVPAYTGLTIGAYGSGAKPTVQFQAVGVIYGIAPQSDDFRVMDIRFTTLQSGTFTSRTVTNQRQNVLLFNLDGQGNSCLCELAGTYNFVVGCTLNQAKGGGGNVGIWYSKHGIGGAILGNSLIDCAGIEHNIRTHGANRSSFSHNYLSISNPSKKLLTVRGIENAREVPPLPGDFWTELILVSDNQFGSDVEDGGSVQVAPEANTFNEPIRNVIMEKNLFSGPSSKPSTLVIDVGPGLVFRNNIAIFRGGAANSLGFINFGSSNTAGAPVASDTWFVGNSLYSDHVGNFSFLEGGTVNTDNHFQDNIAYVPNAVKNAPGNVNNPQMMSPSTNTFIKSNNTADNQIKPTSPLWTTMPPTTPAQMGLQAGSYAKDAGLYLECVREDFFGTLRTGTMDIGAVVG